MSTAQIREKLHLVIHHADERFLKMIYALSKEYQTEDFELSEKHKKIIDERLASHNHNPNSGSNWKEIKARIENRL